MWQHVKSTRFLLLIIWVVGILVPTVVAQNTSEHDTSDITLNQIYEQVSPSVVSINVITRDPNTGMFNQDETMISGGTGFILDQAGHILTNNHVVDGATQIEVNFLDGTIASADIIGLDPDSDLAVLQVNLPDQQLASLKPVEFGDSQSILIGQTVLAIGSPFGQRWTLTSGIISAVDRSIQGLTEFSVGGVIQTDTAINPGNSGGPLLNLEGQVIGINTQILSATRSNAGIGFAVPGNLAQRVARELIENGFVNYSYLGIAGGNISLPIIEKFDIPNNTQGVVVVEVSPGGPAARAGLESATIVDSGEGSRVPSSVDVITAINDEPLSSISELVTYLARETEPGQNVMLEVIRLTSDGTEELTFDVRLTPRP